MIQLQTWLLGGLGHGRVEGHTDLRLCLCRVLAAWPAASVPVAGKGARTTWAQEKQCDEVDLRAWHSHGHRESSVNGAHHYHFYFDFLKYIWSKLAFALR